jgi:hypothetical protein
MKGYVMQLLKMLALALWCKFAKVFLSVGYTRCEAAPSVFDPGESTENIGHTVVHTVNNKEVKEASNHWSGGGYQRYQRVRGRLRHIEVRKFFLRERYLKEHDLKWISTDDNSSDLFTKNLHGPAFEKHAKALVGKDEYMQ